MPYAHDDSDFMFRLLVTGDSAVWVDARSCVTFVERSKVPETSLLDCSHQSTITGSCFQPQHRLIKRPSDVPPEPLSLHVEWFVLPAAGFVVGHGASLECACAYVRARVYHPQHRNILCTPTQFNLV